MRPTNPYSNAHARLRRLYDERIGDSMTQAEFAKRYRIGSGAMLTMLLNGKKPLSIEAAAKLAEGLRCGIYDICPEMGDYLRDSVLPRLGKALRRAAMVLLAIAAQQFAPRDATAGVVLHNVFSENGASSVPVKEVSKIHIVQFALARLLRGAVRSLTEIFHSFLTGAVVPTH